MFSFSCFSSLVSIKWLSMEESMALPRPCQIHKHVVKWSEEQFHREVCQMSNNNRCVRSMNLSKYEIQMKESRCRKSINGSDTGNWNIG